MLDHRGSPAVSPKVGRASSGYVLIPLYWFWEFAFDDASISRAAASAEIEKVHGVDYEFRHILGIVGSFETVVYGE